MGRPLRGDVVVVNFPFSDLSGSKRRPALVLAVLPGDDVILCQITSRPTHVTSAISLEPHDFSSGALPHASFVRPARLFTMDSRMILRTAGHVTSGKMAAVLESLYSLFR